MSQPNFSPDAVRSFFARSEILDHNVLRRLSHIHANWELQWDQENGRYRHEHDSFAEKLNLLIETLAQTRPPSRYHDSENRLAEYVVKHLKWGIRKQGARWVGADYDFILEQGGHNDLDQKELILAATGRIHAALARGQMHFDQMEESHARMLGAVLTIILYHKADDPPHPGMLDDEPEIEGQ